MAEIRDYDPRKVVITYAGHRVRGFGATTKVVVAPVSDLYETHVGADGNVTRIRINDPTYDVTITLSQSSASNLFFSSTVNRAAASKNSADVGAFSIRDLNGETLFEGRGWPQRKADFSGQRTATENAWVFKLVADEATLGGNDLA